MRKLSKHLKHHFIPHEGNDFSPHFFREASIASLLSLALIIFIASTLYGTIASKTDFLASIYPSILVNLTNQNRVAQNDSPLSVDPRLETAASLKAQDMATKGYFAHVSPEGISPWHWFDVAGYPYLYAGENLAVNFTESQDVSNGWMNSPTHRANILSGNFTQIGIQTAEGIYQGRETTFVVQEFGSPIASVAQKATPSPVPVPTTLVQIVPSKTASTSPLIARADPQVRGDETKAPSKPNLQIIASNPTFIAVKNQDVVALAEPSSGADSDIQASGPTEPTKVAVPWYGKILFYAPRFLTDAYIILATIISLALLVLVFFEFRKHSAKHVLHGFLVLTFVLVLLVVSKAFLFPYIIMV